MSDEIIRIDADDDRRTPPAEEGIEIPLDRINPDTLRRMLAEFVTREWGDDDGTLDGRIDQVLRQLRAHKARVVYDVRTETWNIVEAG